MLKRIKCYLLGCAAVDEDPYMGCVRCGEQAGTPTFRHGLWWKFLWEVRVFRARFLARCHECHRRQWPWRKRSKVFFCSDSCFERNIPF